MTDYTQNVFFAPKDSLTPGDPSKRIKGTELDVELAEISTAISSKENTSNKGVASGYASLDGSTKVPVAQLPAATESASGVVELATSAEVITGTDTARATTAAGVKAAIDAAVAAVGQSGLAVNDQLLITGSSPTSLMFENDADTNEKRWYMFSSNGNWYLQAYDDAASSFSSPLTFARSGTVITSIDFVANAMTFNGVSINDAGILTTGTIPNARIQASGVTQHQASLSIAETQITDGSVFPRLAANETVTGAWTLGNVTFNGTLVKAGKGGVPYFDSSTQSGGAITVSTSDPSGTPAAGDLWIKYTP